MLKPPHLCEGLEVPSNAYKYRSGITPKGVQVPLAYVQPP